jgi:hypothetical protein
VYWALMSAAAYKAAGQLLRPSRRHYWELTNHGLVLDASTSPPAPVRTPIYASSATRERGLTQPA